MKKKKKRIPMGEHQYRAVESICERDGLLIEYGTGTGKARIICEASKVLVKVGDVPILVAVPNSLIEQTYEEFQKWCGRNWTARNVKVLDRTLTIYQRREAIKRGNDPVYLMSHEAFSYKDIREAFAYRTWAATFIDEASRFRNFSNRVRSLNLLGKRSKTRYALTGLLMVKTPADVFYVMNYIKPGIFGTNNRNTFVTTYCELGGYMGNVPVDVRSEKLPELKAIMDENRITCQLSDIRKLPTRELKVYRVDMQPKQRAAYVMMRDQLRLEIEHETEATFLSSVKTYSTRLLRLQEIAAGFARDTDGNVAYLPSPKTAELIALLEDAAATPTIVWYWWRPELEVITRALKRAKIPYSVFGEDGSRESFLSGRTNVFVAQLAKGGYGLNLQRATRMVYHSLPWDLDVYLQSQERNMRLNTTAEFLQVIHLLCRGSVDEYVRSTLLRKSGISRKLSRSQALEMLK